MQGDTLNICMKHTVYGETDNHMEVREGQKLLTAPNPLDLPPEDRPRERLFRQGPSSMSDQDLLAIILNSGVRGKNVTMVARDLLEWLDRLDSVPPVEELSLLGGIGKSKACAIAAMLEFGRRRWGPAGIRIREPEDAYHAIRHYADRRQERFICLSLNGAHEIIAVRIVTVGLVNKTIVHPREVFADPLLDRASAVVVAHNHPSGQLNPSPEDDEITVRLQSAADILGVRLLDHLIFCESGFYSYLKSNRMQE